jgi:hypothetical protein
MLDHGGVEVRYVLGVCGTVVVVRMKNAVVRNLFALDAGLMDDGLLLGSLL